MRTNLTMPQGFPKRIHQALRYWHEQHARGVLDDLMLAHQAHSARTEMSARLVTNEILIEALDRLRLIDAPASDLLQRRFPNQETARSIAYRSNMTEDVVYQHQRAAIAQLAKIVWAQELVLRRGQMRHLEDHLEAPSYAQLFGVDRQLLELRTQLENPAEPWLLSVEGMGGIGKTALADAVARQVAPGTRFHNTAWITARQTCFRLPYKITTSGNATALTLAELINQLVRQFDLIDLQDRSESDKYAGVRTYLKSQPCLVILDNFEAAINYRTLVPHLRELASPSKFLITTRHSFRGENGIYILRLEALSVAGTFALVRQEAAVQGLHDLADADDAELQPIYRITGGHPLAVKLVVGQTHTLPLYAVLERLEAATGQAIEELLVFIYADAWKMLDQDSRSILASMLCLGNEGEHLEQIMSICEQDTNTTVAGLHQLVMLSLVDVTGTISEKRYTLSPLTRAFVAYQCARGRSGEEAPSRAALARCRQPQTRSATEIIC